MGEDLEVAKDEIRLGRMNPDYGDLKALGSGSRLLSRKKNDMIKMVFKEAFSVQAGFHVTPPTQKDFEAVHIGRMPGSSHWWL